MRSFKTANVRAIEDNIFLNNFFLNKTRYLLECNKFCYLLFFFSYCNCCLFGENKDEYKSVSMYHI